MINFNGEFNIDCAVSADKSLSHRALILASVSDGKCVIRNVSKSLDVAATVECLRRLGAQIRFDKNTAYVTPIASAINDVILDCQNSGTTARLLAGLVAGLGVSAKFTGDESLSVRPMERVLKPLRRMGAAVNSDCGGLFEIRGGKLAGADITAEVNSAQVKSAVLIAGLFAEGDTSYTEILPTRNHTEIMLQNFGADITFCGKSVKVRKSVISHFDVTLPCDPSAAAFPIALALLTKRNVKFCNLLLNERRTGFFKVLEKSGVKFAYTDVKDVSLTAGSFEPLYADERDVCDGIDEIPVLAAIACLTEGRHVFRNVSELRHKECDRIEAILNTAKSCGQTASFTDGNLEIISNGRRPENPSFKSYGDHRMAMCQSVLAIACGGGSVDDTPFNVSFPEFLRSLGVNPLRFGLIGESVADSKSPLLMQTLARKANVCCSYEAIYLPKDVSDKKLSEIIGGYDGLNVTMPFKRRVAELLKADYPSVNTVGRGIEPQSRDGYGIVKTLEKNGIDFKGKAVWVVGAGGAAEECVRTLSQYGCKIKILNRTQSNADSLTRKYGLHKDVEEPYGVLSFVPECEFERKIILPQSVQFVFSAAYKGQSGLKLQALERNIVYADGLEMLYHQGAKSFALWTDSPIQDDYHSFVEDLAKYRG